MSITLFRDRCVLTVIIGRGWAKWEAFFKSATLSWYKQKHELNDTEVCEKERAQKLTPSVTRMQPCRVVQGHSHAKGRAGSLACKVVQGHSHARSCRVTHMEGFVDQFQLRVVEVEHRLFQIPDSAMH